MRERQIKMPDWSLLRTVFAIAALSAAATALPPPAHAENFFEGKTITLVTSTGIGGSYDVLARAISRYMPRYIPGKPTMIVQNMPGAGNVLATNYMYNIAPKDGTAIAVVHAAMPLHQVLDGRGVRYDAGKFNWLGSTGPETEDVNLAMQRGEVQARAFGLDSILAQHADWLRDKKIDVIAQAGVKRDKGLPGVPLLTELVTTEVDREIMALISSTAGLGHPYLAPPGIPADRLAVLRQAFMATLHDKAFIDEAAKLDLAIDPMDADEVAAIVNGTIGAAPAVVAKAKIAIEPTDPGEK